MPSRRRGRAPWVTRVRSELFGSLGATAADHGTDKCGVLGLEGEDRATAGRAPPVGGWRLSDGSGRCCSPGSTASRSTLGMAHPLAPRSPRTGCSRVRM
ncbi:serine dehydratase beta chain [Geodermatophilus sp. URMC 63]